MHGYTVYIDIHYRLEPDSDFHQDLHPSSIHREADGPVKSLSLLFAGRTHLGHTLRDVAALIYIFIPGGENISPNSTKRNGVSHGGANSRGFLDEGHR